jgi:hypothetical protein
MIDAFLDYSLLPDYFLELGVTSIDGSMTNSGELSRDGVENRED